MSCRFSFICLFIFFRIPGSVIAGNIYGNTATSTTTLPNSQVAVILDTVQLEAGRVERFFATVNEGNCPIRFQIWRPAGGDDYVLVGDVEYTAPTSGDVQVVPTENILVEASDKLGYSVTGANKPCIVYDPLFLNIAKGYSISNNNIPVLNQKYTFSTISLDAKLAVRVEIGQVISTSTSVTSASSSSVVSTIQPSSTTQVVTTSETHSVTTASTRIPVSSVETTSSFSTSTPVSSVQPISTGITASSVESTSSVSTGTAASSVESTSSVSTGTAASSVESISTVSTATSASSVESTSPVSTVATSSVESTVSLSVTSDTSSAKFTSSATTGTAGSSVEPTSIPSVTSGSPAESTLLTASSTTEQTSLPLTTTTPIEATSYSTASRSSQQLKRTERSLSNCTVSSTLVSDVFGSNTTSTTTQERGEAAIILKYLELTYGKVIRFFANFVEANCPMRFQIWRPDGSTNYRLIGETHYTSVGAGYYTVPPTEDIDVEPQDRLGFSVTGFGKSCIPFELDPLNFTRLTWQYEFQGQTPPAINESKTFFILDITRLFGIQVEIGNYVNETVVCPTVSYAPATTTTTEIITSQASTEIITSRASVEAVTECTQTSRTESDVFGSNTSSTVTLETSEAAIILVYLELTYGKVLRFFANFVEANCPVIFQIWRPDGSTYKLIGDTPYTSVGAGYYTVLPTQDIDVEPQDRLGFSFTSNSKSCIPYELDPLNFTRLTWQYQFLGANTPSINESHVFYILDITRLFGIQVEIGNVFINTTCKDKPTTAPVTTVETTTPPTLTTPMLTTAVPLSCITSSRLESDIFGSKTSSTLILEKGDASVILIYLELTYGKVINFFANFVEANCPVRFQIWRPDGNKYKLIGETLYTSVGVGYYTVPPTQDIDVEPQDRLGFTFTGVTRSCIPYELDPLNFTRLTWQYEFSAQNVPSINDSHMFFILDITRLFGIRVEIGNEFNETTCGNNITSQESVISSTTTEATPVSTTPCTSVSTTLISDVFGSNTSSTTTLETSEASIILIYLELTYGKVIRFFANFVEANCPVRLQIWRPDGSLYKLIGETAYTSVGAGYYTITPTEDIDVEPQDRLGFTFTDMKSCIPYELDPLNFTRLTWQYQFPASSQPNVNGSYVFYILDITRLFGIQVEIGHYVQETLPCQDSKTTTSGQLQPPPPPTTLEPPTIPPVTRPPLPGGLTMENFGFNTTSDLVFKKSEVSIILEDVQLANGKLVRFHVFLTNSSCPINLQIWKPEGGTDYSLYMEEAFTSPSDGYFQIPSSSYVDIKAEYKLGFTLLATSMNCIVYEFTEALANISKTIQYQFPGQSEPLVNETAAFSFMAFTKLFAVSVDIATEPTPPTQAPPGPTVPTMTISDVYGNNVTGDKQFPHSDDLAVVLDDVKLAEGQVIRFHVVLENTGCVVSLQIWRPVDVQSGIYYLVGEERFTSPSSGMYEVVPSAVIRVLPQDKLGFTLISNSEKCMNYSFTDERSSLQKTIQHVFTGSPQPQVANNYTFNFLSYTKIFPVMVEIGEVIPMNFTTDTESTTRTPPPITVTEIVNKELYGFNSSAQNALPMGMRTIILKDAKLADGFLSNFFVRLVEPNCNISMQIWRPAGGYNYSLYIDAIFSSTQAGYFEVPLMTPMAVNATDRLGFTIRSNFSGCIAYDEVVTKNQESETVYSDFIDEDFPVTDEERNFAHLSRNYLFSIFAAIGEKITTTVPPPTSTPRKSFSMSQTTTVSVDPTQKGPIGPTGHQGSKGNTGERGPPGDTGETGDRGLNGANGTTGVGGMVGPTGQNGSRGLPGDQGLSGQNGPNGLIGATGMMGRDGEMGNNGSAGDQGTEGPVGADGPKGIIGPTGVNGMTGLTGDQGDTGVTGMNGSAGWMGVNGIAGPTGVAGPFGWTGIAGEGGDQGPMGATGSVWQPHDWCAVKNGGCQEKCTNGDFGPICSCAAGYESPDGSNCIDINECKTKNGRCQFLCANTIGSYECSCPSGYTLSKDKHRCNDIDECELKTDNCKEGYICINQYAGFTCLGPHYQVQSATVLGQTAAQVSGYDVYFVTENVMIGLLIWLIVLTILMAIAILLAIPMITDCCDEKTDANAGDKMHKDFFYPSFFPRVSLSGPDYGGNEVTVERQL